MFIVFYGVNNIGKTTQATRLVERLKKEGYSACLVKYPVYEVEPTGSFLNKVIRSGQKQGISEEELQLWFVLNRYQFQPTLKKWLSQGEIVVAEDYTGTGIAWGKVKGADFNWLFKINQYLLKEDLSILLDGERKKSSKEKNHLHEENEPLMEKCRQMLLQLGKKYGWEKIELQPTKDETAELIWKLVVKHLSKDPKEP